MLTKHTLLGMFRKSHALLRGHFELSSGLHSGHYFQCAQILQYPTHASAIGREIARRFRALRPTVVVGPAAGPTTTLGRRPRNRRAISRPMAEACVGYCKIWAH